MLKEKVKVKLEENFVEEAGDSKLKKYLLNRKGGNNLRKWMINYDLIFTKSIKLYKQELFDK